MWELDYKESWVLKNWCLWTLVLEKTPESPLDCKDIQPINTKGNQSWIFTGRTDAEAEAPILWPELTYWKNPWCWARLKAGGERDNKGWDGWMASLTWWTWVWTSSRFGDGQESLACCSPWGLKESDMIEQLTWMNWICFTLSPLIKMLWFSCQGKVFVTLWTAAFQAPLAIGCPRQDYWSGLPFPSPGDSPYSEIQPASPAFHVVSWIVGRFVIAELL